jgi:hypothetical protein
MDLLQSRFWIVSELLTIQPENSLQPTANAARTGQNLQPLL